MSDKTVIGVDPVNGRSKLTYVDHSGPTSYVTGGEKWPQQPAFGGPNAVGLSDINWVNGGITEDGLYWVVPIFGGVGSLKGTITLIWYSVNLSLATAATTGLMTQPAANANLSASKIRLCVLGG